MTLMMSTVWSPFVRMAHRDDTPPMVESVMPIRGGIDVIWKAFPQAVPDFRVKVIETIVGDGNSIVVQAEMSGPIPADAGSIAKKGQVVHIPHAYLLRFDDHGKIRHLDAYWDNTVLNSIQASAV